MLFNHNYTDMKTSIFSERHKLIIQQNLDIDILMIGDSITQGFDVSRYAASNKTIINMGIGGDQIPFMIKRLDRDAIQYSPSKVIFMGGINDIREWYKHNEDTNISFKQIKSEIIENIKIIIAKLIENNIDIVLCSIIKTNEEKINSVVLNSYIDELNEDIEQLTKELRIVHIDYNNVLMTKYGMLDLNYTIDGLHPNELGYIEMSKILHNNNIF